VIVTINDEYKLLTEQLLSSLPPKHENDAKEEGHPLPIKSIVS
jgi:hypothetical protein